VSAWPSSKAKRVFRALQNIGWRVKAFSSGSHHTLEREDWEDYTWAFHDNVEIGPKMLSKIAKKTGLKPSDL
jgi:predicted RNA binding protein YcfA (HicA-like mRNA interferase family)